MFKKLTSYILINIIVIQSISAAFANENNIIIHESEQNLSIEKFSSDDAININSPDNYGNSYNKFDKFNVENNDVIIKNNINPIGELSANPNLINPAANITFDIKDNEPSKLNKSLTISGPSADFIIYNPNGIFCNGCNFINVNKAIIKSDLTKGKIFLNNANSSGALHAYGDEIELTGNIKAGQEINLDANKINGDHLESMYANYITVTAQDSVKLNGKITASGKNPSNMADIAINSQGYIELANAIFKGDSVSLVAKQDIDISNTQFDNNTIAILSNKNVNINQSKLKTKALVIASPESVKIENSDIEIYSGDALIETHRFYNINSNITTPYVLHLKTSYMDNYGTINSSNFHSTTSYFNNYGTINNTAFDVETDHFYNYGVMNSTDFDVNSNYFHNEGGIYTDKKFNLITKNFFNSGTVHSKQNNVIYTRGYTNNGLVRSEKHLVLGEFKEGLDPQNQNIRIDVDPDSGFTYTKGNEQVGDGGIMAVYAKSFTNNSNQNLNHSLFFNLSGNSFYNYDYLNVYGDFIITDHTGGFYNYGKIKVFGGNMSIDTLDFASIRHDPRSLITGDNRWLIYDIEVTNSGPGSTNGNLEITSNQAILFKGTSVKADGSIFLQAQNDIVATRYFVSTDYALNRTLNDPATFQANGDVNFNSINGYIILDAGSITSNYGDINLNANQNLILNSFSQFYTRSDLRPFNYYDSVLDYNEANYFNNIHPLNNMSPGVPAKVNYDSALTAPNGQINLTSAFGRVSADRVNFTSQSFYLYSELTPTFLASQRFNYDVYPMHWGFDMLGSYINAAQVNIVSNEGFYAEALRIENLGGTTPISIKAVTAPTILTSKSLPLNPGNQHYINIAGHCNIVSDQHVHILNSHSNIVLQGTSITSNYGGIELNAGGSVDISPFASYTTTTDSFKKGNFFNKKTITTTENKLELNTSNLSAAGGVDITANSVNISAANIDSPLNITSPNVEIGGAISYTQSSTSKSKSNPLIVTTSTHDKYDEEYHNTNITGPVTINTSNDVSIITEAGNVPSWVNNVIVNGAVDGTGVQHTEVTPQHTESYSTHKKIAAPALSFIGVAAGIASGGIGASLLALPAGTTSAAIANSVLVNIVSQIAVNAAAGNGLNVDLKSVAIAGITSGANSYVSQNFLNTPLNELTQRPEFGTRFVNRLESAATSTLINTSVKSLVRSDNFVDTLKDEAKSAGGILLSSESSSLIGQGYHTGVINKLGQGAFHFITGCAAGAVAGDSCYAQGAAQLFGEVYANQRLQNLLAQDIVPDQDTYNLIIKETGILGGAVSVAFGGDDPAIAASFAQEAAGNNAAGAIIQRVTQCAANSACRTAAANFAKRSWDTFKGLSESQNIFAYLADAFARNENIDNVVHGEISSSDENNDQLTTEDNAQPTTIVASGGAPTLPDPNDPDDNNNKDKNKDKNRIKINLDEHENGEHNGHTKDKHIGKTPEQLRERFNNPKYDHIDVNSSFKNQEDAERIIEDVVNSKEFKEAWDIAPDQEVRVTVKMPYETGYGVFRGSSKLKITDKVFISVEKNLESPQGFNIITAYPRL